MGMLENIVIVLANGMIKERTIYKCLNKSKFKRWKEIKNEKLVIHLIFIVHST